MAETTSKITINTEDTNVLDSVSVDVGAQTSNLTVESDGASTTNVTVVDNSNKSEITVSPDMHVSDTLTVMPGAETTHNITISYPDAPPQTITVQDTIHAVSVVTVGVPGPQGPKGDDGGVQSETITATASTDIDVGRVVTVFDGVASYADNISNYTGQLGVTLDSAVLDGQLTIQITGIVTNTAWNFSSGFIWLGQNGVLTQTEPETGISFILGSSYTTTSFLFDPVASTEIIDGGHFA